MSRKRDLKPAMLQRMSVDRISLEIRLEYNFVLLQRL